MASALATFLESRTYRNTATAMACLAVFTEPVAGLVHYLGFPINPEPPQFHHLAGVQLAEGLAVLFFGTEFFLSLWVYGARYLRSVYAWINVLVVLAFIMVHLTPVLGLPDPLLLRVVRLGRAMGRIGLVERVTESQVSVASEDAAVAAEDDIRFTFLLLFPLLLLTGVGSIGYYYSLLDPLRELLAYGLVVLAIYCKALWNRRRVRRVVLQRIQAISEENRRKLEQLLGRDFDDLLYARQMNRMKEGGYNEFDHLLEQINLIFHNLKRFVSDRTLREARGESVIPENQPVALMFTDLEGFTRKTQLMGKAILPPLSLYFETMVEVILRHGGDIERFLGDAIFAFFLVRDCPEDSANRCLDAAIDMELAARTLMDSEAWNRFFSGHLGEENRVFKTRFGLHWGRVTSGALESDREDVRTETTLMGDEVNLAARLESLNKKYGTYLLLSGEFYGQLSPDRKDRCRLVDYATVKGREEKPLYLYTVDLEPKDPEFLQHYQKGCDLYFQGKWYEALLCFERAFSLDPLDGPTRNLMKRIHLSRVFSLNAIQHLHDKLGEKIPDLLPFKKEIELTVVKEAFAPPHDFLDRGGYWRWEEK